MNVLVWALDNAQFQLGLKSALSRRDIYPERELRPALRDLAVR